VSYPFSARSEKDRQAAKCETADRALALQQRKPYDRPVWLIGSRPQLSLFAGKKVRLHVAFQKNLVHHRGIARHGLAIALRAARDGANIAIAAKTEKPHPKLPATIYTAADEVDGQSRVGANGRSVWRHWKLR
jgi:hypothetical protein